MSDSEFNETLRELKKTIDLKKKQFDVLSNKDKSTCINPSDIDIQSCNKVVVDFITAEVGKANLQGGLLIFFNILRNNKIDYDNIVEDLDVRSKEQLSIIDSILDKLNNSVLEEGTFDKDELSTEYLVTLGQTFLYFREIYNDLVRKGLCPPPRELETRKSVVNITKDFLIDFVKTKYGVDYVEYDEEDVYYSHIKMMVNKMRKHNRFLASIPKEVCYHSLATLKMSLENELSFAIYGVEVLYRADIISWYHSFIETQALPYYTLFTYYYYQYTKQLRKVN